MLNRVEHTDIAAAIRTTVRPYMAEHGFHEDKVLALYIEVNYVNVLLLYSDWSIMVL